LSVGGRATFADWFSGVFRKSMKLYPYGQFENKVGLD
jgi:hypothetical protein